MSPDLCEGGVGVISPMTHRRQKLVWTPMGRSGLLHPICSEEFALKGNRALAEVG